MKPDTIKIIMDMLKSEVESRKDLMLRTIQSGSDSGIQLRIKEYQEAYHALDDFEDWVDEQED